MAVIVRAAGWIFIGGISLLVGVMVYRPLPARTTAGGDGRPRSVLAEGRVLSDAGTQIIERYSTVLGMTAVAPVKVVPPGSADPIDQINLVGVVGKNGETFAVFILETGDSQKMISVRTGEEVVAAWIVERIDNTSAILIKAGKTKKFMLFE